MTPRFVPILLAGLLVGLLTQACARPERSFVGEWSQDRVKTDVARASIEGTSPPGDGPLFGLFITQDAKSLTFALTGPGGNLLSDRTVVTLNSSPTAQADGVETTLGRWEGDRLVTTWRRQFNGKTETELSAWYMEGSWLVHETSPGAGQTRPHKLYYIRRLKN